MNPGYTKEDVSAWLATMAGGTLSLLIDNPALAMAALSFLSETPSAPTVKEIDGRPTPNFTWREFLYSDTAAASDDITNVPTDISVLRNIQDLAGVMEQVRTICGANPVIITSGYRSPDTNAAVGGVPDSAHLSGCACDFTIPNYGSVSAVISAIEPYVIDLGIDQLINESGWIHLGLAVPPNQPRHEVFSL